VAVFQGVSHQSHVFISYNIHPNTSLITIDDVITTGVKRPRRGADRSLPSSAEVKHEWSYTSTPQYVFMTWCLIKQKVRLRDVLS
jgi:hypothetical protein